MVVGGLAGLIAIIGLSLLIHRRLTDPRIRATSRRWDIAILLMLWAQLALGLLTVPGLGAASGRRDVPDTGRLHQGDRDCCIPARPICSSARHPIYQAAYPAGLHHLPGLSIHPPGACMERAGLVSRPPRISGRAHEAAGRKSATGSIAHRGRSRPRTPAGKPTGDGFRNPRGIEPCKPSSVNDVAIPHATIAREVQNHPAESPAVAWEQATRALVIRELLLQRARALDLVADPRTARRRAGDRRGSPDPAAAGTRGHHAKGR